MSVGSVLGAIPLVLPITRIERSIEQRGSSSLPARRVVERKRTTGGKDKDPAPLAPPPPPPFVPFDFEQLIGVRVVLLLLLPAEAFAVRLLEVGAVALAAPPVLFEMPSLVLDGAGRFAGDLVACGDGVGRRECEAEVG